jgi:hypothetical protein
MGGEAEGGRNRRVSRGATIAVGGTIAVPLLMAGLFAWGGLLNARLDRRKAGLRAAGMPTSVEELMQQRQAGGADSYAANGLLRLVRRLGALSTASIWAVYARGATPGVKHSDALREAVAADPLAAGPAAGIRSALASVRGFPLPQQTGYYWGDAAVHALLPATEYLSASARIRAEAGDGAGAAEELATMLELADSIGEHPLFLEYGVMALLDAKAAQAVEETLSLVELPGEGLARVRTLVERPLPAPEAMLQAERAYVFSVLREARASDLAGMAEWSDPIARAVWRLRLARPGRRAAYALLFDSEVEGLLAACVPGLRQRRRAIEEASERLAAAPRVTRAGQVDIGVPIPGPASLEGALRREVQMGVTAAGLAIEQWRAEHSAWPESLEQLVPDVVPPVLEDPYSEGELLYRRTDEGVVVYSIGPDGVDDGGLDFEEAAESARRRGQGWDLSFRLLDPGRRGAETLSFREEAMGSRLSLSLLEGLGFNKERLRELGLTEEDLEELR